MMPTSVAAPLPPFPSVGEEAARRFELRPFADIKPSREQRHLIKGLIARNGLTVVWGPPKSGKSFWAFDAMLHVAAGRPYRGRPVAVGTVVYIAAEGAVGFEARIAAARRAHFAEKPEAIRFFLVQARPDLIKDCAEIIAAIEHQLALAPPVAVVIDTLNRTLAGSESSDEDMGAYMQAAAMIEDRFKCAVVVVHHCGIDGSRPRGHTSLTGAADTQLAVSRDRTTGLITTRVEFMKDGAEGAEVYSRLDVVEVGTEDEGEPITTCVVVPEDESAPSRARVSGQTAVAIEQLQTALAEGGRDVPASDHIHRTKRAVRLDLWRTYFDKAAVVKSDKPDSRLKAFKRAVEGLQTRGLIGVSDDWVWIQDKPDKAGQR